MTPGLQATNVGDVYHMRYLPILKITSSKMTGSPSHIKLNDQPLRAVYLKPVRLTWRMKLFKARSSFYNRSCVLFNVKLFIYETFLNINCPLN